MSDNVVQTGQKILQDVIAPDVRETKVRLTELEKRMDERFRNVDARMDSLEKNMDARFAVVNREFESLRKEMAAGFAALRDQMEANTRLIVSIIGEGKAQMQLAALNEVLTVRERVAVLESQAATVKKSGKAA